MHDRDGDPRLVQAFDPLERDLRIAADQDVTHEVQVGIGEHRERGEHRPCVVFVQVSRSFVIGGASDGGHHEQRAGDVRKSRHHPVPQRSISRRSVLRTRRRSTR